MAINLILGTLLCKKNCPVLSEINFFLRNVFLTRYLHKHIVHSGFQIWYYTKTKVMVSVVHYTVALYPILLKADASKKKYKQVFIYYLLGQQKSRLVELERCFQEAIGLHHGLCWLCEVFLQYSVQYFGIAAVLNCRTGEQYSNDLCTQYFTANIYYTQWLSKREHCNS